MNPNGKTVKMCICFAPFMFRPATSCVDRAFCGAPT